MIAVWIAHGMRKAEIARKLNVDESTIWRWLRVDEELQKEVKDAEIVTYQKAMEEVDTVAFKDVEITSASKMQALFRIIDNYETKLRRQAGEVTMDDAHRVLMNMCALLMDMPEARQRVMDAYRNASREDGDVGAGPGALPGGPVIDGSSEP